jgi:hypothetical protein
MLPLSFGCSLLAAALSRLHQLVAHAQFCSHTGTVRQTLEEAAGSHAIRGHATTLPRAMHPSTGFIIIMMLATARVSSIPG